MIMQSAFPAGGGMREHCSIYFPIKKYPVPDHISVPKHGYNIYTVFLNEFGEKMLLFLSLVRINRS